jgi:hypothetical protein
MLARTGPFSNTKVIALINEYFAPVYVVNQDYQKNGGTASADEKAEFNRIRKDAWAGKDTETRFSPFITASRDICIYIVASNGHVVDAIRLPEVGQTDKVHAFLEAMVTKLKLTAGKTLVTPKMLSVPPKDRPADSLTLHVTTRYLTPEGKRCACPSEFEPTVQDKTFANRIRAASQLPSEKWLVFNRSEWNSLLGPEDANVGTSWEINPEMLTKLYNHFYPPSENNELERNHIDNQSLTATLVSTQAGMTRVRLDGHLKLKHPFVRILEDELRAECSLVGYMDVDTVTKKIRSLRLASSKGTYTQENFGVAVRSVP